MESLYVLQLAGGKYYIGKTADVNRRIEQHNSGKGSAWTKLHAPVKVLEVKTMTTPHDENNLTKDYMKKYGIDNVRGGSYAQLMLPEKTRQVLECEIRAVNDACYICGGKGHYAKNCSKDSAEEDTDADVILASLLTDIDDEDDYDDDDEDEYDDDDEDEDDYDDDDEDDEDGWEYEQSDDSSEEDSDADYDV